MSPLKIVAEYTTPGTDITMDVVVDSSYQDNAVLTHMRLVPQLRVNAAGLRKQIGRMEEEIGNSEFRVHQLEASLGFFVRSLVRLVGYCLAFRK